MDGRSSEAWRLKAVLRPQGSLRSDSHEAALTPRAGWNAHILLTRTELRRSDRQQRFHAPDPSLVERAASRPSSAARMGEQRGWIDPVA